MARLREVDQAFAGYICATNAASRQLYLDAVAGLFLILNVVSVMGIVEGADTCLSAGKPGGGCAVPAAGTGAP